MSAWDVVTAGVSGAIDFASNRYMQEKSAKFNKEAMRHRHQWEVTDLKKAGLNPILSATGGQPPMASSPALSNKLDIAGTALASAQRRQIKEATRGMKLENDIQAEIKPIISGAISTAKEFLRNPKETLNMIQQWFSGSADPKNSFDNKTDQRDATYPGRKVVPAQPQPPTLLYDRSGKPVGFKR